MTVDHGKVVETTDHAHVLVDEPDHVFVDSVAVTAERGCGEVRLYTNAPMTKNLALYPTSHTLWRTSPKRLISNKTHRPGIAVR